MIRHSKVSPAFKAFMAESRRGIGREAIVVFRTPWDEKRPERGHLRSQRMRQRYVRERAQFQTESAPKLFRTYLSKNRPMRARRSRKFAFSPIGSNTLPVAVIEVTRTSIIELAANPDVLSIMPNQKIALIQPKKVDNQELAKREASDRLTWGLKLLGAPRLWEASRGEGINVAILDTGVHAVHSALNDGGRKRVVKFAMVDPLGTRIQASPEFDGGSHGTHVCGTIAGGRTVKGVAIGVAPDANLLVGAVLLGDATLRTLLEGLAWAVESGAEIVNMSLGFSYYEPLFAQIFEILLEQFGVLPVVAIGNENHGSTNSPGNAYNALSVGAVEKGLRGKIDVAPFSSGASLVFPGHRTHSLVTKPDICAPGAQVYSCVPPQQTTEGTYDYSYMDGTSMATPHVAGVCALLMAAKPTAPVSDIVEALKQTARHPNGASLRPDNRWGYGLIQPLAALNAL